METEHTESTVEGDVSPPPVPAPTPTNLNLNLTIPSSILMPTMPTIPIYTLQQTAPDAICSLTNSCDHNTSNAIGTGTNSAGGEYMNGNMLNVDSCLMLSGRNLDWSNNLFRPVSRFSMSNRRECKSTSDETTTFELSAQAIDPAPTSSLFNSNEYERSLMHPHAISPFRYQLNHSRHRNIHHSHNHHHANLRFLDIVKQKPKSSNAAIGSSGAEGTGTSWSLSNAKAFYGQFGLNPSLFNLSRFKGSNSNRSETTARESSSSSTHVTTNKFHRMGTSSNSNAKDRKFVKRLSSSNKFGIESLNKKHGDFNHNKKLFHAVLNEDPKAVSDLLETNQYDVNCCDEKQRTCLHIASSRGNSTIVRLLLQHGASPNIKDCVNNLPIHVAIIASHVEVVTLLLEAGTDINALELNGKTVLHLAGTRLRYLLSDDSDKVSPKLKCEAIMIMNMIKEYLNRKKTNTSELDALANQLENVFTVDDINHVTKELLSKFESFTLGNGSI